MPYHLNTTKVFYANSSFAPVAVVQLDMEILPGKSAEFNHTAINAGLFQISSGSSGGPLSLFDAGSAAAIYTALVLELQRYAGHSVQYSRLQTSEVASEFRAFIEYEEQATALYAAELATELLNAIMVSKDNAGLESLASLQLSLDEYVSYAAARCLDPNSRLLMQAAERLHIPLIRLDQPPYGKPPPEDVIQNGRLQFGWGIYKQRCISSIAETLTTVETLHQTCDLAQLLPRLQNTDIPLANQDLEFINRNQPRRAQRSARRIGYPVTLRPRVKHLFQYRLAEDHLFGPLHTDEQVGLVVNHLRENAGQDVWVESHVTGGHYRFLILNNEVLSIVQCTAPTLSGDGVHSITELARNQADAATDAVSRRSWYSLSEGDEDVLCRLQLAAMNLHSIPAAGTRIVLRATGTPYNGGNLKNVTPAVPAKFNTLAIQAAEASGIGHLAEIALIIDDLSGPAQMPNCTVTDVSPTPDLQLHDHLSADEAYHIGDRYLMQLFPAGHPSRIPTVAVTGTNGKTTTCRMVTHVLQASGQTVGLACSDGIYLDGKLLSAGDESGIWGANDVLMDPHMQAAVLETARGGMVRYGIAFDRCEVGACLNIANDHLGQEGIETLDELAALKRQVIERAIGVAVLNAEDPRCLAMREHTAAQAVILVANSVEHAAIEAHCQAGGRAVVIDTAVGVSKIAVANTGQPLNTLIAIEDIPATLRGAAYHNVYNAMFAVGICLGLGISQEHIIAGLKGFEMGIDSTPGRLNEIQGFPFKVLVDAAHNVHGYHALVQFIHQLPVDGKKIIVFGARGSLTDSTIREIAAVAAGNFDRYILKNYQQHDLRGRSYAEVPEMLKQELITQGVSAQHIKMEPDILASVDCGLEQAKEGDLLIILVRAAGNEKLQVIKKLKETASN